MVHPLISSRTMLEYMHVVCDYDGSIISVAGCNESLLIADVDLVSRSLLHDTFFSAIV